MPVSARRERQASSQPCIFQISFFFFFLKKRGVWAKQREALVAICFTLRNETITCLHRCTVNHFDELARKREFYYCLISFPWNPTRYSKMLDAAKPHRPRIRDISPLCSMFIHSQFCCHASLTSFNNKQRSDIVWWIAVECMWVLFLNIEQNGSWAPKHLWNLWTLITIGVNDQRPIDQFYFQIVPLHFIDNH